MVSSYLICDGCGRFGPPASFLSQDGLRLCYQCWYEERANEIPPAPGASAEPEADAAAPDKGLQPWVEP